MYSTHSTLNYNYWGNFFYKIELRKNYELLVNKAHDLHILNILKKYPCCFANTWSLYILR